jgi:hypothetical protein
VRHYAVHVAATPFESVAPSFWRVLQAGVSAADEEHRFRCRNFILDEHVTPARATSYAASAGASPISSRNWLASHGRYLRAVVGRRKSAEPTRYLDRTDDAYGEPFLAEHGNRTSLGKDITLIRVVDALPIIESGLPASDTRTILARVAGHTADPTEVAAISYALDQWNAGRRYVSPEWVGLYAEVADLFGLDPADDKPTWAAELVDRMGLAHLDGEIDIALFRYEVEAIPRDAASGEPLCAIPTVLDGVLFGAFCPTPTSSREGHVLDLDAATHVAACEFVHPYMRHDVGQLFRVATLTHHQSSLAAARHAHFEEIRRLYDRPDFGVSTGD